MDLTSAIRELYEEKEKLEQTISLLERLQQSSHSIVVKARGKRGRKFMGPEERKQVSERMRKYWAGRRSAAQG